MSDSGKNSGDEYCCPICFEELLPPIFQCYNGHMICSSCIDDIRTCPICRDDLPGRKIRSLLAEQIIASQLLPCPFSSCKYVSWGKNYEKHKAECEFVPMFICPLLGFPECEFGAPASEIVAHLVEEHKVGTQFAKDGNSIEVKQLKTWGTDTENILLYWTTIIIILEGIPLFLTANLNSETVSWILYALKDTENTRNMWAKITLITDETKGTSVRWKGPVVIGLSTKPDEKNSFVLPARLFNQRSEWTLKFKFFVHGADRMHKNGRDTISGTVMNEIFPPPCTDTTTEEIHWHKVKPRTRTIETGRPVMCLRYDSSKIIAGLEDGSIRIWDVRSLQSTMILQGHTENVSSLYFDNKLVISGSADKTMRVWDLETGETLKIVQLDESKVFNLKFKDSLLVTSLENGSVLIWEIASPTRIQRQRIFESSACSPIDFDKSQVVARSPNCLHSISVWNTVTGVLHHELRGHSGTVNSVELRGSLLLSGSNDHTVRLWDLRSGSSMRVLHGHDFGVRLASFESMYVVSCAHDGQIKVWDLQGVMDTASEDSSLCLKNLCLDSSWPTCMQCGYFRVASGHCQGKITILEFC